MQSALTRLDQTIASFTNILRLLRKNKQPTAYIYY